MLISAPVVWIIGDLTEGVDEGSLASFWGYTQSNIKAHSPSLFSVKRYIDGGFDDDVDAPSGLQGLIAFLLQLGSIADGSRLRPQDGRKYHRHGKLRIMFLPASVVGPMDSAEQRRVHKDNLFTLCNKARIDIEPENIHVFMLVDLYDAVPQYQRACNESSQPLVPLTQLTAEQRFPILNLFMAQHSLETCQIIAPLPLPCDDGDAEGAAAYVRNLNVLTQDLPPTILVCHGEDIAYISTCI